MIINSISLFNYRGYKKADINFGKNVNFFIGNNGSGKTNLLEAIYFLALAKSYKSLDIATIKNEEEFARIIAKVKSDKDLVPKIIISKLGKKIIVNNSEIDKLSDYIGRVKVLAFLPEDMDLVKGHDNISALELKSEVQYNGKHKGEDKSVINIHEAQKIIDKYKKLYIRFEKFIVPFIKRIKEKIIIKKIYLNTELGTNDAAETAVITGIIWSLKSYAVTILANNFDSSDIFVNVVPNYNIRTFKTSIDCIFSIKLGNIINAGLKTLLAKKGMV